MGHLLVVENWVEGTGRLFPKGIVDLGHEYTFISRNMDHYSSPETNEHHPVLKYARNVLSFETNDLPSLTEFLKRQHEILKFDGVITICDYYVETAAAIADALDLPQAYSKNVAIARRKHLVRQALDNAGIPNPKHAIAKSLDEAKTAAADIGYPLIAKPSDLGSSAFVRLVQNEQELTEACEPILGNTRNFRDQERDPVVILEEYLQGQEVSVECCSFDGKTNFIGITDKSLTGDPYFIEDGHMFPADLSDQTAEQLKEFTKDVLAAIGYENGVTHTEVKLTENGPRLIEVNPRPAGNYIVELIEHVTGIDLMKCHIDLALGHAPDLQKYPRAQSAAIKFVVPQKAGQLVDIKGYDSLEKNNAIARYKFVKPDGHALSAPIDNACYVGHVVTTDPTGKNSRAFAEDAVSQLELVVEEQ